MGGMLELQPDTGKCVGVVLCREVFTADFFQNSIYS